MVQPSPMAAEPLCYPGLAGGHASIQNNSDLAQGPLPIRPSKVRRSDIYLAPGGVHGTETS